MQFGLGVESVLVADFGLIGVLYFFVNRVGTGSLL